MQPWIGDRAKTRVGLDGKRVRVPQPVAENDERLTLEYCRGHRDFFRLNALKIATKARGLQPFEINTTQRALLDAIDRQRRQGIPPRMIVLKSRQVGISTISEAEMFSEALFNPHRSSLVLAHTKPAAKGLLRMTQRFYRNLPNSLRVGANLQNVHELELENGSRVQVEAVGDVRSYTAQYVHLSEFAFWENAPEVFLALMQSVPFDVNSLAIIESTANGVGNKFHQMWLNAIAGSEDPDAAPWDRGWTPVFIPWFKHEEYRMKPWFSAERTTNEERVLAKKHGLDMTHIAWRRWCIKTNCDGDLAMFQVEYPSSWQEAFALSGRPVFDSEGLAHYEAMVPTIVNGVVNPAIESGPEYVYHKADPLEIAWDKDERKPVFDHVEQGRLRIFQPFNPRHTYIIGADPSEGDTKSDPSPLQVLDQMTLEFVAEWWGRTPPDMLAEFAAWLGIYYGNALIIGEANNHGVSFHGRLLALEYPNLYYRTTSEESVSGEITDKPGYWETNKAKHLLIDTYRKFVREKRGAIYSPGLVSEMRTTIYERRENFTATKIKPQPGNFIDRVMAAGMALFAHRGDEKSPLLPLPEIELYRADQQIRSMRDRDPHGAARLALDLTGMSEGELSAVLAAKETDRMRAEMLGMGGER